MACNPDFFALFDDWAAIHPADTASWTEETAFSYVHDVLALMALDHVPDALIAHAQRAVMSGVVQG